MFLIMRAVHRGHGNVESRAWRVLCGSKSNSTSCWLKSLLSNIEIISMTYMSFKNTIILPYIFIVPCLCLDLVFVNYSLRLKKVMYRLRDNIYKDVRKKQ